MRSLQFAPINGVPPQLDGLFHGKSHLEVDDDLGVPLFQPSAGDGEGGSLEAWGHLRQLRLSAGDSVLKQQEILQIGVWCDLQAVEVELHPNLSGFTTIYIYIYILEYIYIYTHTPLYFIIHYTHLRPQLRPHWHNEFHPISA